MQIDIAWLTSTYEEQIDTQFEECFLQFRENIEISNPKIALAENCVKADQFLRCPNILESNLMKIEKIEFFFVLILSLSFILKIFHSIRFVLSFNVL